MAHLLGFVGIAVDKVQNLLQCWDSAKPWCLKLQSAAPVQLFSGHWHLDQRRFGELDAHQHCGQPRLHTGA